MTAIDGWTLEENRPAPDLREREGQGERPAGRDQHGDQRRGWEHARSGQRAGAVTHFFWTERYRQVSVDRAAFRHPH